jgi:hypothetical protein
MSESYLKLTQNPWIKVYPITLSYGRNIDSASLLSMSHRIFQKVMQHLIDALPVHVHQRTLD